MPVLFLINDDDIYLDLRVRVVLIAPINIALIPVDLYHWSSAKFESTWRDTISVLVARGRAQVGVHSAKSDWSRRILDFAYMDYDDQAAHHE